MKKALLFCFIYSLSFSLFAQISASGVYEQVESQSGMGLEHVYVFKSLSGATIICDKPGKTITPYIYQNNIGDTIQLAPPASGISTIGNLQDGRGYTFDIDGQLKSVWVIDYSQHEPILNSIAVDESGNNCEALKLLINKTEDNLTYKGTGGNTRIIPRKYTIEWNDIEWDATSKTYINKLKTTEEAEIGSEKNIDAPLIEKTSFVLKGDQFAKAFGISKEVSTSEYIGIATEAHIIAEHNGEDITDKLFDGKFEVSSPYTINFETIANPASYYYKIAVYNTNDMNTPLLERTDPGMDYEFINAGSYEIRLSVANDNSGCATDAQPLKLKISVSELDAPNFFSPGDSPGSNDEFKVKYKSLVQFKCTIFNRWGVKIYEWTDPSKGWDGKHNGRYVAPGVYFYVIQAKGSEGKVYKRKGDINILRSK